jgi:hypothetical protein
VLHGVIDDTQYDIFCMKEEDYVMMIMEAYGSNCPPIQDHLKTRRTVADGSKVQFEYIKPIANHFDYQHGVDDNKDSCHMRPPVEETWKTHRGVLRQKLIHFYAFDTGYGAKMVVYISTMKMMELRTTVIMSRDIVQDKQQPTIIN